MTETNRSEAARKAWATRRKQSQRPAVDKSTPKGRILYHAKQSAAGAIGRAKKAGMPVDVDWMRNAPAQIEAQGFRCALTGLEFDVDYRTEGAGGTHLAPSPDRIDPKLGYVKGNVRWVLWAINRAKGEMPEALFLKVFRSLIQNK